MSLVRYRRNYGLPTHPTRRQWVLRDPFGDEFFQRFFDDIGSRADRGVYHPAVDVSEEEEAYKVSAELPGVAHDDIHVEVLESVLTLKAERKDEREDGDDEKRVLSERAFGSFERRFRLPDTVDTDSIGAELRDGVLTLTVPKLKIVEEKPRQIEVSVG